MPALIQVHCNQCGRSTNHDLLHEERSEGSKEVTDNGETIEWLDSYQMLRCRGCESITMRHRSWFSEDQIAPDDDEVTDTYFPPRIARRAPYWTSPLFDLISDVSLPDTVVALMREVYVATQNGSRRLAAMGIRAVLEMVMIEKVGDHHGFSANVDALQEAGYVGVRQALALNSILEAGHATIHRGWEPTVQDVNTLLDIAESVIETVYLHEHSARDLEKRVPQRSKPPRPKN